MESINCAHEQWTTAEMDVAQLKRAWSMMVRIRRFEERVGDLVEAREIRTPCHLCIGQEAIATGVCLALDRRDTIWGGHRSHGHYLAKGGDLQALMAELFCRTTGCSHGRGGSMHLCDPAAGVRGTVPIVAGTIPLAVGAALASRFRRDADVAVSFFGDGATEEGHFHESMNFAALHKLPVIFVCENNLYSSHLGLLERRAKDNIVESAFAHGIPGLQIDGNDVEAVNAHSVQAVTRARRGEGPTLLECRTFRWRGHVGPAWDLDVGVKRKDELLDWLKKDPIERALKVLASQGIDLQELDALERSIAVEIEEAIEFARASPRPDPGQLLEHIYAPTEDFARCV